MEASRAVPEDEIVELVSDVKIEDQDEDLHKEEDLYSHLSEEERVEAANTEKEKGNKLYGERDYDGAAEHYTQALRLAPPAHSCRAVFYSNRAACYLAQNSGLYEDVVKDTTEALKIDPSYIKALMRRGQAYEALGKLSEALKDFEAVLAIDSSQKQAQEATKRLPELIKQKQEEEKERMLSQLKEMGNSLLGKFGLSLDNFKMEKDPTTGNYSIKMG